MPMPLKMILVPLLYHISLRARLSASRHGRLPKKPRLQPAWRRHRRIGLRNRGRRVDPQFELTPIVTHGFFLQGYASLPLTCLSEMENLYKKNGGHSPPQYYADPIFYIISRS